LGVKGGPRRGTNYKREYMAKAGGKNSRKRRRLMREKRTNTVKIKRFQILCLFKGGGGNSVK